MAKTLTDPVSGQKVRLVSRKEAGLPKRSRAPTGIFRREHAICHHGVGRGEGLSLSEIKALWRGYHRYHTQDHGWSDIGYSFGFADAPDVGGAILVGRSWGRNGAHTQNGGNSRGYACCYVGDGRYTQGRDSSWRAWRAWLLEGIDRNAFADPPKISGHSDWYPKSCPGSQIKNALHRKSKLDAWEEDDDMPSKEEVAEEVIARFMQAEVHGKPFANRIHNIDVHSERADRNAKEINAKLGDRDYDREVGVIRRSIRKLASAAGVKVTHSDHVPDEVEA